MSQEDEEILIGEVLAMKEQGFDASRSEVLPRLYVRRYGAMYRTDCGGCVNDAFNHLIRWAQKGKIKTNQYMSNYKMKFEYRNKSFPIMHKGQRLIITADNLTDDRAKILMAIPKYAHVVEVSQLFTEEKFKIVKRATDKVIAPNFLTPDLEIDNFPNESSTSTSKEVLSVDEPLKKKRGRPFAQPKG